jgi:cation diffusion facilitator family transporter
MINRSKTIVKTSIIGILTNFFLVVLKAIIGLVAGSVSIFMDAINNLSDVLSSVVTIVGTKLAQKKPDKEHPYGHGRIEYLTSLFIGIIIVLAGIGAIIESISSIIRGDEPSFDIVWVILIAIAVIVKIFLGLYYRYMGKKVNSESLKGSGVDALFDAFLSFGTLVSIIVMLAWNVNIEGYIGSIIGLFMIRSGIGVLIHSMSSIIGERTNKETTEAIKHIIYQDPAVIGAYDLFITNFGPDFGIGSIHIEVNDQLTANELHSITKRLSDRIHERFGIVMTIGIFASNNSNPVIAQIRETIKKEVETSEILKEAHGFYCNQEAKIVTFDVIIDYEEENADKVIKKVKENLTKKYPDYQFYIIKDEDIIE